MDSDFATVGPSLSASQTRGFSLKRAYVVSIALHFIMAACIVFVRAPKVEDVRAKPLEAVRVATLTIVFRPHHANPRYVTRPRARTLAAKFREASHATGHAVAIFVRQRHVAEPAEPARPVALSAAAQSHRPQVAIRALVRTQDRSRSVALSEPAAAPAAIAQSAVAQTIGSPLPAPQAPAEPTAVAVLAAATPASASVAEVPSGGWGQRFAKPLVADDEALASLRASAHAGGTVTIEVDESGRATHVTFPKALANDVRAELERRFLAMHYVPAECNGLRCTGTLELSL